VASRDDLRKIWQSGDLSVAALPVPFALSNSPPRVLRLAVLTPMYVIELLQRVAIAAFSSWLVTQIIASAVTTGAWSNLSLLPNAF